MPAVNQTVQGRTWLHASCFARSESFLGRVAAVFLSSVQGRLSQWVETQRAERAAMAARMIKLQAEHMGRSNHVDSFRAKMKWTEVHPPTP